MTTPTLTRALGKKAGVVEDPRTFRLSRLLTVEGLPPVMDTWRIAGSLRNWGLYANDEFGCCVFASLGGHRVAAQEFATRQRDPLEVTTEDVLAFYTAVTGFDRNNPATDNGAYPIDALRYARKVGFGKEADGSPHTIKAYASVTPNATYQTKRAAHLFGGLYIGAGLPLRVLEQSVWDLVPNPDDRDEIYSWGGHAMWVIGYTKTRVKVVTWGAEQWVTWRWFEKYVDEAWVVITEDFANKAGRTPQGLNVAKLEELLASLG